MHEALDYGLLDRSGAATLAFYPRAEFGRPPGRATDYTFDVEPGVVLGARLYVAGRDRPTILYFHGNGEVASDHDGLAPHYFESGVNLFVFEFRGYGTSSGRPTSATLVSDARVAAAHFHATLDQLQFDVSRFVMGRSLGAHSALEVASNVASRFRGLIIESGAGDVRRFLARLGVDTAVGPGAALTDAHDAKIRGITLPTLIIHGERDELVPVARAAELYDTLQVADRQLVLIPDAGHNDLTWVGSEQYFTAIAEFVKKYR
jgi:uncharacterized protein